MPKVLNDSGQLSFGGSVSGESVNLYLGSAAGASINMNDAAVRAYTNTTSGTQITIPDDFWRNYTAPSTKNNQEILSSGTATSGFSFTATGNILQLSNNADVGNWVNPQTNLSDFDIRATLVSGVTPSGSAVSTWLNLGTTRSWSLSAAPGETKDYAITFEIRDTTTSTVVWTSTSGGYTAHSESGV